MAGLCGFQAAFKSGNMFRDFGMGTAGLLFLHGECRRNCRIRHGRLKSKCRGTNGKSVAGMHTLNAVDRGIIQPDTCTGSGAYGDEIVV